MLCEKCNKRPAKIRASFLGKNICNECYLHELEKKVKRNISCLKFKGVAQNVFVPFHPLFPLSSILLLHLMIKIEKKFSKSPILIVMDDATIHDIVDAFKVKVIRIILNDTLKSLLTIKKKEGLLAYWRFTRGLYVKACHNIPKSILILPGCADFLAYLDLYSLIVDREIISENVSVISDMSESLGIVNGFYGVPCKELMTVSYLTFKHMIEKLGKSFCPYEFSRTENTIYKMLQSAVYEKSYEALVNVEKSIKFLLNLSETKKCVYCKGITKEEDACRYCSELREFPIEIHL